VLPKRVRDSLRKRDDTQSLIEVVMDLGRLPEARFPQGQVVLDSEEVSQDELSYVVERVGHFGDDNRAGIERTLHRISVIRNRAGEPVGLTCRVGRAVFGSVRLIHDLIEQGQSVLLLGRPGVGKTTLLREVARVLADDYGKRVVVVDTSNEIAGDGDVPHPAIGHARRMQVANTELQHRVMIEAVENHMPEVIVIDEMSTELEALAARTIAERGVQLVATAHGNTLANLVSNPTLSDLAGGTQTVTLGDVEARRRRTQKTVLERRHDPTFAIVVEIKQRNEVGIHLDVGVAVDRMLRGIGLPMEVRTLNADGSVASRIEEVAEAEAEFQTASFDVDEVRRGQRRRPPMEEGFAREQPPMIVEALREAPPEPVAAPSQRPRVRVHPFGVPRTMMIALADELNVPVDIVDFADDADIFVTTKSHYNRRPTVIRRAERDGLPVYVLRRGTADQAAQFLQRFLPGGEHQLRRKTGAANGASHPREERSESGDVQSALREAEMAAEQVTSGARKVELSPQSAYIRRLQHGLAASRNLGSASMGKEPARRVVIRRRTAR
jgi:stage III sporulation protein SpoIIIAA